MKQFSQFILLILFVASCTSNTIYKKPTDLIEKDEMINLILEIQIANGARNIKNKDDKRLIEYMPLVYEKYGIDSAQFANSNFYYSSRIDDYTKMLKAVQARLAKLEKEYDRKVFLDDSINKLNQRRKGKLLEKNSSLGNRNEKNLIKSGSDFSNILWKKLTSNSTASPVVTTNHSISPDGHQNADRIQLNLPGDNEWAQIEQFIVVPLEKLVGVIWLKANGNSQIGKKVWFGVHGHPNHSNHIQCTLTSEWKKFEALPVITPTNRSSKLFFGKNRISNPSGFTDSITATDFFVWGAELIPYDNYISETNPNLVPSVGSENIEH